MLRNYLKTALRSLWKNRTYGLLNIGGLAIGIACAALIFLWVESELTHNHNHVKRDRLYLVMNNQAYAAKTYTFSATPGLLAGAIKAEIPGIVNTARAGWGETNLFSLGDQAIYEKGNYVDAAFFQLFTIPFVQGKPENVFPRLHSVAISEKLAAKFFGQEDPIGKVLLMNRKQGYTVTGVFRDMPESNAFRFEWLVPFEVFAEGNDWLKEWGSNGVQTFVELAPSADPVAVNRQLHGFIHSKAADAISTSFLFNMNEWRLYSKFADGKHDGGRIEYVRLFTIVAWVVLFIACINFMNLATARSEKRAREVGMRKVLGGTKRMLIGQFIGESLLLSFISVGFAVLLAYLALPFFNELVEKQLALDLLRPPHLGALLIIGLLTGLVAGSYPAFYLSSFRPVAVLKGLRLQIDSGAGFIRKGLVVLQFTASVVLIVGTLIVYQQVQYVKARELGYEREHLIYLTLNDNRPEHFSAIRNELLATGVVENAALSFSTILQQGSSSGSYSWEGKELGKDVLVSQEYVTPEYVSTMGLRLVAGRNFRPGAAADTTTVLINEAMARLIKTKDVVGSLLSAEDGKKHYEIVGVVNDFVYNDFYAPAAPMAIFLSTNPGFTLTIRLKAQADLPAALDHVGAVMRTANPGYPFEPKFVDEEFGRNFKSEALIGKLAGVFAGLAILISCLGLFGLAAYTAERRTREIGIRKVLGASMQTIVQLLSRDFLQLVSIACLVAFPLAWWALSRWLDSYAYRTPISWWVFGAAGLLALLIALVTVSFQAIKAALANPVKSLRTE